MPFLLFLFLLHTHKQYTPTNSTLMNTNILPGTWIVKSTRKLPQTRRKLLVVLDDMHTTQTHTPSFVEFHTIKKFVDFLCYKQSWKPIRHTHKQTHHKKMHKKFPKLQTTPSLQKFAHHYFLFSPLRKDLWIQRILFFCEAFSSSPP